MSCIVFIVPPFLRTATATSVENFLALFSCSKRQVLNQSSMVSFGSTSASSVATSCIRRESRVFSSITLFFNSLLLITTSPFLLIIVSNAIPYSKRSRTTASKSKIQIQEPSHFKCLYQFIVPFFSKFHSNASHFYVMSLNADYAHRKYLVQRHDVIQLFRWPASMQFSNPASTQQPWPGWSAFRSF